MKSHRLSWLVAVALAMAVAFAAPPPADAGDHPRPPRCWVKNTRTMTTGFVLSTAIQDAHAGDTLKIRGLCSESNLGIDKDLALLGPATIAAPEFGYGAILFTGAANVTLRNLVITGGTSTYDGGGIYNSGTLKLKGATSVTGNWAEDGGGGISNYGTLIMTGTSSVSGNSLLWGYGGGIYNYGTVIMSGASSVTGNTGSYGGGIANHGIVIMQRWSSVTDNSAETGGGIYNYADGTVIMKGSSSVTGNTAGTGGGIANEGTVRFSRYWTGTVCGNNPDDWPRCP